ncbi:hypothetical protein [Nocardia neocaledoniensis]|uniref:hypothetical protein n=1 Tax=Nocardia neocaledoniensis TaxID=236511 RepID=UPI002453CD89|nr:hypothetical protein [Nocardia neocaledoniensis]
MSERRGGRFTAFGPESFVAVLVGFACISLPYLANGLRNSWWLVLLPPIIGVAAFTYGDSTSATGASVKRAGAGLLVAFAGFVVAVAGFLAAIGIAALI